MTRFDHSIAYALLIPMVVPGVLAGNQLWESSVKLQAPHPVQELALDSAGYAIRDNATHGVITKRYVAMKGLGVYKLWPDKTISYCFETQETRDRLGEYLVEASRKWQRKGLHRDVFRYAEVAKPGWDCVNNKQRANILVISYNTDGILSTTLGLQSLDAGQPSYRGPIMAFSDRQDVGLLDTTANMAHELGHAWGLAHEHQNQYFWSISEGQGSIKTAPFSLHDFDCTALKDYQAVSDRASPKDKENICRLRRTAYSYGFSAAEWLPILENMNLGANDPNVGYEDVDWDSIMIYPSGTGGKGSAAPPAPGQAVDANDRRANVLVRRDGQKIRANFDPSDRDVEGIRKIYNDDSFPEGQPVLLLDKNSKWYDRFINKFTKDKCVVQDGRLAVDAT